MKERSIMALAALVGLVATMSLPVAAMAQITVTKVAGGPTCSVVDNGVDDGVYVIHYVNAC